MDEYTVFVHRVARSLDAAGLYEAAEEIRRTLLPAPDEVGDEGPEDGFSDEGDARGPWPPRPPAPGGSPFTAAGAGASAPAAAESGASARNSAWYEMNQDDLAPPHL